MRHAELVSDAILKLQPYPPGKPLSELARELGVEEAIKLASNENPYGPSPKAIAALADAASDLHRYPDGAAFSLRRRVAQHLGVDPAMLVFGTGSNEILELLIRTFTGPERGVVTSATTFVVYELVTRAHGAPFTAVPMKGLAYDLDGIADAVDATTRLVFLCNPNNPTGSLFAAADLERFLERVGPNPIVVLDEAYWEFVDPARRIDALDVLRRRPRTVVLRTFSKAYGLAGLRVGYGIMDPELANYLDRVRQPFNVNTLGQVAAEAALDDVEYLERVVHDTRIGLARLADGLRALGLTPAPTEGNFVLFDCHRDARPIYDGLLARGVIIRPMSAYGLPQFLRVNAGTDAENERFLSTLAQVL